jgi:hypothetical protein
MQCLSDDSVNLLQSGRWFGLTGVGHYGLQHACQMLSGWAVACCTVLIVGDRLQ